MLAKVESKAVCGIEAKKVEVEVDINNGLPHFAIVGLADTAVKESRDRVISAIKNSGFKFPPKRITINLAPADLRKEGASFDLPIAIGILIANGELEQSCVEGKIFCGELSLDGKLRPIEGALAIAIELSDNGRRDFIIPYENAKEAAIVKGVSVYPVKYLYEVINFLKGNLRIERQDVDIDEIWNSHCNCNLDFSDVKGQWHVKRGLEVAAAGGHNVLMIGPPGSGKTMLAERLPTILPGLSFEEALETTKIHSVAGLLNSENFLISKRPFRMPHHTVSYAGLVGGGINLRPGEISLAHNGVLFLDELPEFHRDALEALRQPLEGGNITISRAAYTFDYPAKFMLVAAMNPCKCGNFNDLKSPCRCSPNEVYRYRSKISGPLLDRIDVHLEVPSVRYQELTSNRLPENSAQIKERVDKARAIQRERLNEEGIQSNASMSHKQTRKFCELGKAEKDLLKITMLEFNFSARAYDKILKISRTIADLSGFENIKTEHLSEAIQYRSLDRDFF